MSQQTYQLNQPSPMLPSDRNHGYHGKCLRRRHVAGLIVSERVYAAGLEIPAHTHEYPFLCAVLRGASSEASGGKVLECTPRTLLVRPSQLIHSNRVGENGLRFLGIELAPDWSARWDQRSLLPKSTAVLDGVGTGLTRKLYREFRWDDGASTLVLEGLVVGILGEACRATFGTGGRQPPWLRRARDFLHARYRQPPSLTELAHEVGIHPLHLARVFRRTYSCTVGEYVRRLRIDFACCALTDPRYSLVRIALDAGFADQSQFCRTFKRLLGVTPSQYRRETLER
jgi:AraC family transcriptional regulator